MIEKITTPSTFFGFQFEWRRRHFEGETIKSYALGFGRNNRDVNAIQISRGPFHRWRIDEGWLHRLYDWIYYKTISFDDSSSSVLKKRIRQRVRLEMIRHFGWMEKMPRFRFTFWVPKRNGERYSNEAIGCLSTGLWDDGVNNFYVEAFGPPSETYYEEWSNGKPSRLLIDDEWQDNPEGVEYTPEVIVEPSGDRWTADGVRSITIPRESLLDYFHGNGCDDQGWNSQLKTRCVGSAWLAKHTHIWWVCT